MDINSNHTDLDEWLDDLDEWLDEQMEAWSWSSYLDEGSDD